MKLPVGAMAVTAAILVAIDGTAWAQRSGESVTVQHGRVIAQEQVDLQSAAGRGALIGGVAGLASGSSRSQRWRNTVIGAGVGGAIAGSAEGSRTGMEYTVETAPGKSVVIVSDQTGIQNGDCVAVEEAGNTANIRRVGEALCAKTGAADDPVIEEELEEEASECAQAKQGLLDAESEDEIERAVTRVQVLCDD